MRVHASDFGETREVAFDGLHEGALAATGWFRYVAGVAAILVPIGNVLMESTGTWATVLYAMAAMDIFAALMAILVLRPLLKRHHAQSAESHGYEGAPAVAS